MIRFFVERPVFANVIALIVMLLGAVALINLPIAQYPPITPPTVQVVARFPGASAATLIDRVALPIETQVNGVENALYMQSTSTNDGTYTLTVTFAVGTDVDKAQVLVQNRVSAATAQLPQAVQQQGVTVRKRSTAILQLYTLQSPDPKYDSLFLSNYAVIYLRDTLARLPGVGDVTVFGTGQYSMRVWLDPQKLSERNLTAADVMNAIQSQSREVSAGQLGSEPNSGGQAFQLTVTMHGALSDPREFDDIIVKADPDNGGHFVRIRDVGRTELGSSSYGQFFNLDGKPAAGIAIYQLPEANALEVGNAVKATMARLAKDMPKGVSYQLPFDTTTFVRQSVIDVYKTLFEAALLVLAVILLFLQNWRAMLVPATTIPVTIIGTFGAIYVLGFSINLLTLFAIVLAIGIVVDDAIVVVEGITQHIEQGKTPKQAAIDAMHELLGPIIGITLVLVSVFLPSAFLGGVTGQMYRQFALVVVATTVISAINAVTLKPVQSVRWLRHARPGKPNIVYRVFDKGYARVEKGYVRVVSWFVARCGIALVIALLLGAGSTFLLTRIPTSFIPLEDQGYVLIAAQLADAASLGRTREASTQIEKRIGAIPGVSHVVSIGGISPLDNNASLPNSALIYVTLDDWSKRGKGEDLRSLYLRMNSELAKLPDIRSVVIVPPPIQGLGNSGGVQMQVMLTDGSQNYRRLQDATDALIAGVSKRPELQRVFSPFRASVPTVELTLDRAKAESLQVPVGNVFDLLQDYVGSSYVNQFTTFNHTFPVFVQADGAFRRETDDIRRLQIRSNSGHMVELGTFIDARTSVGPAVATLYNLAPAAAINGNPAAGYSTGDAIKAFEQEAARILPAGIGYEWTAMSYQEKLVGNSAYWVFAVGVLLVFCVLAAQYESWLLPIAVVLAVPLALLGTAGTLAALGAANNLYTQIGLVLLIALSAKNAILIVEFARHLRAQGVAITEAAIEAARLRFRPIMMTSFAFILGVVPLVIATGASASARRSLGIAVFSGMLASTCIAVLFIPSFYVLLQRLGERHAARKATPPDA
ncbi:HAE1 family hydrophobic/amphiphilic exporter-1 [Paraburkholderia sp. BL6669N2]|uniref:efflux RND transporter permease subunit n=1 Tax=Paraburkholderia sp. BL6669N2 TaxID=1938807 RepID=UPI000E22F3B6|nr:efflux RND transporter permease subunit [Paraburkholderia sp. BL6669N2]REG50187.1 HAE1 family hydrophobic/amphiphilic exporter-1 [Paraburkholderia sp. BL6669N2]